MMLLIKLSRAARRLGKSTFWRCGVQHTIDGAKFADDQFSADEWARLRADPMLEVTEVPEDAAPVPTEADKAADLRAQVRTAIEALSWDEYTKGGLPQLGAVRATATLADQAALKDLVASVWAEMTAAGFVRPVPAAEPAPVPDDTGPAPVTTGAPEPVPSAGAAQDDAGAPEEA